MAVADRWISPAVILTKVRIHSALRRERSAEWIPDQVRDDGEERGGRSAQQDFTPLKRSAQQDFTPLSRSAEHGFTLIELMVVLTIIGFISAAVVIAIPDPRGRIVDDADRFAARVAAARDEAVVTARPMGVWVSASGYGFLVLEVVNAFINMLLLEREGEGAVSVGHGEGHLVAFSFRRRVLSVARFGRRCAAFQVCGTRALCGSGLWGGYGLPLCLA